MEGYKQTPRQERNVENDKQAFLEAVASISVEDIPTVFDEEAAQELAENLTSAKVFILGEMHGVKENTDVIYTLFKKFGFRQLALEWDPELEEVVDKYLATGEIDFDAVKDSPDGRITAGHFALFKKLHSEGLLDQFVCFDVRTNSSDWNKRDENMASALLKRISDKPMLAVAGNLHAQTAPITFEDEPGENHPMGERVKQEISDVPSGKIKYLSGQFHNFGTREFGTQPDAEIPEEARFFSEDGQYIFELSQAHAATVPNPSERI